MKTMKSVRIHHYGDSNVLSYEEAPCPKPGRKEVLIRVIAAGVNPVDWKMREGRFSQSSAPSKPMILGIDVSGIVEAIGEGVTKLHVGQAIYGTLNPNLSGAYAEYAVGSEDTLSQKPISLTHIEAASVPVAAMTAWQALFDKGDLLEGQSVLIHAAAGGVGSFAVQLAKWKKAYVIGTASARNQNFVRQLGADEVIDYKQTPFDTIVQDVDLVLDTLGGEIRERSWNVLKPSGKLVAVVKPAPEIPLDHQGKSAALVFLSSSDSLLTQLSKLFDTHKIRPCVEEVLPLVRARDAQELSQSGHTRGKIVLEVSAK